MNLGYACINMQLSYPQQYGGQEKGVLPITTGRSMIKRTFESKGLDYASELALANAKDLDKIIDWNILNGFNFFRITSGLAPWKSEYDWTDLKDLDEIKMYLHSAGVKAKTHNLRITSHPGPFNVLTSPHQHVVDNCVNDLTMHGDVFDMLGLTRTHFNKINIHIGGAYGDKPAAMKRFCENFNLLPESVKSRLTVENDDKASMYSVKDLYHEVYNVIGVPIVFDYHHHKFCDGGLGEQEALELAISTWPEGITPATHYSESRREEQGDDTIRVQAHSDYIYDKIDTYGNDIDIMVEAKRKELAVQKYLEIHGVS
jgi:UV DNA damage endonuclease|tara:strand:+ start:137 stop:1081 length:945 start_codon:yes stop_codon:yes gene_type:complete